jgi:hypothetical protein
MKSTDLSRHLLNAKRVLFATLLDVADDDYTENELELITLLGKDEQIIELFDKQNNKNIKQQTQHGDN